MPDNVFGFQGPTGILPHGFAELRLRRPWRYVNEPVEIVLDELDFSIFEVRRSRQGGERRVSSPADLQQLRDDIAAGNLNNIGKITSSAVRPGGGDLLLRSGWDGSCSAQPDG